ETLHRGERAHGHEGRSVHNAVGRRENAGTRCAGGGHDLEAKTARAHAPLFAMSSATEPASEAQAYDTVRRRRSSGAGSGAGCGGSDCAAAVGTAEGGCVAAG